MDIQQLQRIKSRADELFMNGKLKGALEAYESVRGYSKADPKLLMRLGDIQRKLGNNTAAIEEYKNAVKVYAKNGFIVKAIAVCKLILSIDPSQRNIEKNLAALYSQRVGDEAGDAAKPPVFTSPPPEDGAYETEVPLDEGKDVSLAPGNGAESNAGGEEPLLLEEIESVASIAEDEAVFDENLLSQSEIERLPESSPPGIEIEFEENWVEEDLVKRGQAGANEAGGAELLRTPLFSDLGAVELAEVIGRLKIRSFGMGDYVYRAGEISRSIFVITSGAAEEIGRTKYGEEIKCATLMEGDFFGEDSYFSGLQRKTDLIAVTTLELLEIEKDEMESLAKVHSNISSVLSDFYKERVLDRVLATSKVFRHLVTADRRGLLELASIEHRETGSDIVREGIADDEKMYIIASGAAEVWKRGPAGSKLSLARLLTSDYFGEVALMLSKPRTATVTALSPIDLIAFSREGLTSIFARYPIVRKVLENMARKHFNQSGNQ